MQRRPCIVRRTAALLALAVVAVVAAACGRDGDGPAAAPATVTVTVTDLVTVTVTAEPAATTAAGEPPTGSSAADLSAPTPADGAAVLAAVAEVVLQCRSVAAGFVEEPEPEALERALGVLADAAVRLDPDASFATGGATELAGTTTLRDQLDLARRQLAGGCAPELAARLR